MFGTLSDKARTRVGMAACVHVLKHWAGSCEAVVEGWNSVLARFADVYQHASVHDIANRMRLSLNGITAAGGNDDQWGVPVDVPASWEPSPAEY